MGTVQMKTNPESWDVGDGQGTKAFVLMLLSYIFLKIRNKLGLSSK